MAEYATSAEFGDWMNDYVGSTSVEDMLDSLGQTVEWDLTADEPTPDDLGEMWSVTSATAESSSNAAEKNRVNPLDSYRTSVKIRVKPYSEINNDERNGDMSDYDSDCDVTVANDDAYRLQNDIARTSVNCRNSSGMESRRSFSYSGDKDKDGRRCMSRNAIIARENRSKKKKYEESLKAAVTMLSNENTLLKKKCHEKEDIVNNLTNQVNYLKSVIANSSVLSRLLRNIPNCLSETSINLDSLSDVHRIKSNPGCSDDEYVDVEASVDHDVQEAVLLDHDYAMLQPLRAMTDDSPSGVCLHVATNRLSLEFCATCSHNSLQTFQR